MPKSTGQYLLFEPITKRKILRPRIDHLFSANVCNILTERIKKFQAMISVILSCRE